MTPERYQKVVDLFHAALEVEPEARPPFLSQTCTSDEELRTEVEAMLAADAKSRGFLDQPPDDLAASVMRAGGNGSLIGQRFLGYELIALLGAGGMGEVYRAHDSKLGRDVAIKALPAEFARDPDRLARFRREARTLASLNHPNIAAIYGLEESGDLDCLVLELVEGETLRGPLPVTDALRVAKQIAEALGAAHEKGIIHRDLKPANIKITPDGRVKVLDFGLAKAVWEPEPNANGYNAVSLTAPQSLNGHIVGTPGYMSPEQARGQAVDRSTDIWAFGCVLYELLTGKRVFYGDTQAEIIAAVLEREPDWQALPAKIPRKVGELLRRCLQKEINQRLPSIADARKTLEQAQHGWNWRIAAVSATVLVVAAVSAIWFERPVRPTGSSQWVQLTKFSDSVSQPALSPDGRMAAFIRSETSFLGAGEIYVKILPDGEPVQLTHDNLEKMSPVFSPDGARIAYTTVNQDFGWDTWTVPVLGGEPQMMLKNASGLVWTRPRQIMFSEIRMGLHMAVVTSEESRIGQRDVYVPPNKFYMAHRSYLSPDGKWVLLVEMDMDHLWEPCRLVPADGSSSGHKVGPPGGGCTFAAWSPDGKWMYFTSNPGGTNHIWRQRFPDGVREQITAGPTEEEGIAMAPDGRSLVTGVSLRGASLWLHDPNGDRQISLEGNAGSPVFTPDGAKLLYRVTKEQPNEFDYYRDPGEIMIADLRSGRSEPLVRGFQALNFDISRDGRQVVMEAPDGAGWPRLWLAPLDHSATLRQVPNVVGVQPHFLPNGEIIFRHNEAASAAAGSVSFIYRVLPDGTGLRKAVEQPVHRLNFPSPISPDGRWVFGSGPLPGNGRLAGQVYSLEGKATILLGARISWAAAGALLTTVRSPQAFFVPLAPGHILPPIPPDGFWSDEKIASVPRVRKIEGRLVTFGPTPNVYAFYRGNTQRNLYRIPIP